MNIRWWKLGLIFLGFIILTVGLGYIIHHLLANLHILTNVHTWLALLIFFGVMIAINISVLPLPFGVAFMLFEASVWNPVLVALVGSLGASMAEFSSYFFGYLGKKVAISDETLGYKIVHRWVEKYGMWAIAILSFQPILPFEIGGFISGVARMPIRKFLPANYI